MWCLNRIYQLNQSRSRCKCSWDATIVYLTHAILEKQLTALNVVHTFHLFNWYVFILLTKTRTETKTVPSTWYIFNVQALYTHWLFSLMCHILSLAYMRNRPHKHTHTNKKETVCLMTSAHPTFSPHNVFFNSHHDECTSFLITQLSKNKRKFIPKVLKVHINWIQLYLYSASLRNQYKLKP